VRCSQGFTLTLLPLLREHLSDHVTICVDYPSLWPASAGPHYNAGVDTPLHALTRRLVLLALTAWLVACRADAPAVTPAATHSPQPTETATVTASPSATASASPSPTITPTLTPTRTPRPTVTPTPTATPPAWSALAPGISRAYLPVPIPDTPEADFHLYALRIDPRLVDFEVAWDGAARTMADWQSVTQAEVVINGGFFNGDNRPIGRIVIDGELYGTALDPLERIGVPGLFTVIDGEVEIYSLGRSTAVPNDMQFDWVVEAYPMLLLPGGRPAYPRDDEGPRARRTVVGIDRAGYVVIVLCDGPIFSLSELSRWLAHSNLNLDVALNFDGGRSSGMAVNAGAEHVLIPSYVPLPIVLAVSPR
jgi:uncharacterized protein YigE (DUF2233 family)